MLGSLLVAVSVTTCPASSRPPPGVTPVIPTATVPASSRDVWPATGSNAGASFTALTAIVNAAAFTTKAPPSSVASTVTVTEPLASVSGWYASV